MHISGNDMLLSQWYADKLLKCGPPNVMDLAFDILTEMSNIPIFSSMNHSF